MKKIREFVSNVPTGISEVEKARLLNNSSHSDDVCQVIFNKIDEFVYTTVRDISNDHANTLFSDNLLTLVSDAETIEKAILDTLKKQGHVTTSINNPEILYKAYNFHKPDNLLPFFNHKLINIKKVGISEDGKQIEYILNPYFFNFIDFPKTFRKLA